MRMGAALNDERSSAKQLRRWIDLLSEYKGYRALEDQAGVAFTSFEEFCRAPMPYGLGYDVDAINAVIDERKSVQARAQSPKALTSHGGDRRSDKQSHNVTLKSRGNSADYLIAVLSRDHPDILKRLQDGEFKSARAAAIAAGIVASSPSFSRDPLKLAATIAKHYTADEAKVLVEAVAFHFEIGATSVVQTPKQTKRRTPFSEATPLDMTQTGTPERAWRLIEVFKSVWSRVSHTAEDLQEMIEILDRERVWDQCPQGKPYGSLDELVRREIGKSVADLDHVNIKGAA